MSKLKSYVASKLMHYSWDLAFMDFNGSIDESVCYRPYRVVKNPYTNKWFADPFILELGPHTIELLVEEFDYNVGRGRIAKITIDRGSNSITDCKILLDLSTHLSFPAIYRYDKEVYVVPENSANNSSTIYRYNANDSSLQRLSQISNLPLVDSVYLVTNKGSYLFATQMPNPNGNVLSCFKCESLKGPFEPFKEFAFSSNIARMGGAFLVNNGSYIRPAQNCNGDYGKSLIFQKMTINDSIEFQDLLELKPTISKYQGIHTFNTYKDIAVIDLKKYDYPLIYKIRCSLKKILHK